MSVITESSQSPPALERVRLVQRDRTVLHFRGRLLGHATSYSERKERWFEVSIYKSHDTQEFVVHTVGRSKKPDEVPLIRIVQTASAFEVLAVLIVNHNNKTYLPRQSDRALAQAAHWDDDIRDAYINRAVL